MVKNIFPNFSLPFKNWLFSELPAVSKALPETIEAAVPYCKACENRNIDLLHLRIWATLTIYIYIVLVFFSMPVPFYDSMVILDGLFWPESVAHLYRILWYALRSGVDQLFNFVTACALGSVLGKKQDFERRQYHASNPFSSLRFLESATVVSSCDLKRIQCLTSGFWLWGVCGIIRLEHYNIWYFICHHTVISCSSIALPWTKFTEAATNM